MTIKLQHLMRVFFNIITFIGWPLLIWIGLFFKKIHFILPVLLVLFITKLIMLRNQQNTLLLAVKLVLLIGVFLLSLSLLLKQYQLFFYYPILVNSLFFIIFISSLWRPQTIVERIARLKDPVLSEAAVCYTRQVTKVWSGFFFFNGSIAAFFTILGNETLWLMWNGLISYILTGILMISEWLIRQRVKKRNG